MQNIYPEVSGRLASALKAKSKFVGIPMEGHAPLIFERTKLQRSLKGVAITLMAVITSECGMDRWLRVEGSAGPRVSCKYTILSKRRTNVLREMYHGKKLVNMRPKSTKYDAAIKKLEREMGPRPRIVCGWNIPSRKVEEWDRQRWADWRAGKSARTAYFREEMARSGRELALINARSYRPGSGYYHYEPKPEEMWGVSRYSAYLSWRHYTAPIREQIDSIRQIKDAALVEVAA